MKVVVTGATGYIGHHIVKQLLSEGHLVAAVVRQISEDLPTAVDQIVDHHDDAALFHALVEFEAEIVIHCAASQILEHSIQHSAELVETNVGFGARMLAVAHAAGVIGFVAAGTFSTHADGSRDYEPQNLYAATKEAFKSIATHYQRNTSMKVVTLEISDTYGSNDPRPKFLNLVSEAARNGTTLEATLGLQIMYPIHVDDVANAFVHCAQLLIQGVHLDTVYSVHGPTGLNLQDLVQLYESVNSCAVPVLWGARAYRGFEIMSPYVGLTLPEWSVKIPLEEGLKHL
ncbi:MAG: hypothetical protein RIS75_334 [Actinomycetota bacterium]